MSVVEKSIEVELPVSTVYNQWTQFEEFPQFMEGVEQVTQLDDTRLHWVAEIAGAKPGVGRRDRRPAARPAHRLAEHRRRRQRRDRDLPADRRRPAPGSTCRWSSSPRAWPRTSATSWASWPSRPRATSSASSRSWRSAAPRRAPGGAGSDPYRRRRPAVRSSGVSLRTWPAGRGGRRRPLRRLQLGAGTEVDAATAGLDARGRPRGRGLRGRPRPRVVALGVRGPRRHLAEPVPGEPPARRQRPRAPGGGAAAGVVQGPAAGPAQWIDRMDPGGRRDAWPPTTTGSTSRSAPGG